MKTDWILNDKRCKVFQHLTILEGMGPSIRKSFIPSWSLEFQKLGLEFEQNKKHK